jgi:hypothetical protein
MTENQKGIFDESVYEGEVGGPQQTKSQKSAQIQTLMVPTTGGSIEEAVVAAEKYADALVRIKKVAIKLTSPADWVDFDGKPFPQHTAANKIAQAFGISVYRDGEQRTMYLKDKDGEYIQVETPLRAVFRGTEVSDIGICSTRDKLLGRKNQQWRPLAEVDLGDIKRKSYSSGFRRVVFRALGFNPTWDDLKEAKITQASCGKVEHTKGSQGGSTATPEERNERQEYWKKIIEFTGDEMNAADWLEAKTAWTDKEGKTVQGKRGINSVSEKQWNYTGKNALKPLIDAQYKAFMER